jgi:hypothetical protein
MKETVVRRLASAVDARLRSIARENREWQQNHEKEIEWLVDCLPSGSGWDSGTKLDLDRSTGERLVLYGGYHHMNENGFYDGWTEHEIWVRASLQFGIDLKITGRDRHGIKDYLCEMFQYALTQEAPERKVADATP